VTTPADLWAPFALRVEFGPLELRAVTDDDIGPLADLARDGLHEPGEMPFARPWTDAPADQLARNMANYYWSSRASFTPDEWVLDLVVRLAGEIVGVQGFRAKNYLVVHSGETGSWLGRRYQGKGIGTMMRQAMCALLFDHLDAEQITSAAFTDNPTSLAVSRKVGYIYNGTAREQRRPGEIAISNQLLLTPDRFRRGQYALTAEGVTELRRAIGLTG
jgi:RimJ/RimL family protein N-acetyltransferase